MGSDSEYEIITDFDLYCFATNFRDIYVQNSAEISLLLVENNAVSWNFCELRTALVWKACIFKRIYLRNIVHPLFLLVVYLDEINM